MKATRLFQRTQKQTSVFDKKVELRLPKLKDLKKPTPAWISALVGVLVLVLAVNLIAYTPIQYAQGAYTSSTTDTDGNTHLGNNSVNDTYAYDTTQDSSPETQQQLGIDPNWRQGVTRKSYALKYTSASSSYAATGSSFPDVTAKFTLEGWIYPTSVNGTSQGIITKDTTGGDKGYGLALDSSNKFRFWIGPSSGGCPGVGGDCGIYSNTVTANTWYHVAAVYDGSTGYMYVNGVLISSGAMAVPDVNSASVVVGRYYSNQSSNYFSGIVDEVRISSGVVYNTGFTPSRRLNETNSTVGLWHFDEGTGSSANDSSANNQSMTLNSTTWVTGANAIMDGYDGSKGYQNKSGAANITLSERSSVSDDSAYELKATGTNAISFSGTVPGTSTIDVGNGTSLEPGTSGTVEAWVKRASTNNDNYGMIVAKKHGAMGPAYSISHNGDGITPRMCIMSSSSYACAVANTAPAANTWYHVAGVWTPTTVSIYINGTLSGSASHSITPQTGVGKVRIGSGTASGSDSVVNLFSGVIDEVRISSTSRYSADFTPQRRYATDAYTAGLWHMDEGTSTSVADSSGNGNTGTAAGGYTWTEGIYSSSSANTSSQNWALPGYSYHQRLNVATTTAVNAGHAVETTINRGTILDNKQTRPDNKDWRVMYQPSNSYSSLSFDGGDFVTTSGVTIGNSMTVAAWVNVNDLSSERDILGVCVDANSGCTGLDYKALFFYINPSGGVEVYNIFTTWAGRRVGGATANGVIQTGSWYHIAATLDAANNVTKIFVNGVAQTVTSSNTGSGTGTAYTDKLTIGGTYESFGGTVLNKFSGSIDDVRIYGSLLSEGAVTNLAQSTAMLASQDSNLLAYLRLDEGSGQTVVDSSGNNANGILGATTSSSTDDPTWQTTGTVLTTQEVPRFIPHGNAVSFDGTNDIITTGQKIADHNNTFTAEAWIYSTATAGEATYRGIFSEDVDTSNKAWGLLINGDGKLMYQQYNSTTGNSIYTNDNVVTLNTWTHVALTRSDNGGVSIYVNGVKKSLTSTTPYDGSLGSPTFRIGAWRTDYFKGYIDEVRLSNTIRYTNGFIPQTAPFASDGNTSGLWHMDDSTAGTTIADQTASGYTGTFGASTAAPTWITNGGKVDSISQTQFKVIAPIGASTSSKDYYIYYGNPNENGSAQSYNSYGLTLDGTDDYISVPDSSSFDFGTGDFTYSTWINISSQDITDSGGVAPLMSTFSTSSSTTPGTSLQISNSGSTKVYFLASQSISGSNWLETYVDQIVYDGSWHHITAVRSGTALTLYIDGVAPTQTKRQGNNPNLDNTNAFEIGRRVYSPAKNMKGKIDDVRVYKRALSATEVSNLYSNTPTVSTSNLSAHWKFNDATASGTNATDSAGSNTGTLTNFNFNATSNWIVNKNLKSVATEPTQTSLVTEQESPTFFEWRDASSSWPSDRSQVFQLGTGEQQLGNNTVYVTFNPQGVYSRQDYYVINSWAVEAFSTSSPQRGRLRSFPQKVNIVVAGTFNTNTNYLDIIDASTNKLWMRFHGGTFGNMLAQAACCTYQQIYSVSALNGRIYLGIPGLGVTEIRFDLDTAHRWTSSGNSAFGGNIAARATSAGFGSVTSTSAIYSSNVYDVDTKVVNNKQYVALGTGGAISVINNVTAFGTNSQGQSTGSGTGFGVTDYYLSALKNFHAVKLASSGSLYGAENSTYNLYKFNNVTTGTDNDTDTSADVTYNSSSTPATSVNSTYPFSLGGISLTEGTSLADNGASNTLAIAYGNGVEVLQEHSTQASGWIRHYKRTGSTGTSNWSSKQFGGAIELDGTNDYVNTNYAGVTGGGARTIEAWIYYRGGTYSPVVSYGTEGVTQRWDAVVETGGDMSVRLNNAYIVYDTNIPTNTWTHVAWAFPASGTVSQIRVYVNGSQVTTVAGQLAQGNFVNTGTTKAVRVGIDANDTYYFNGYIDELRFSDSERYTGSSFNVPTGPFSPDSNTKLLLHLDEIQGQTLADSSSTNATVTRGASTTAASDDGDLIAPAIAGSSDKAVSVGIFNPPANTGSALNFDGSGDYITVADNAANSLTSDFTLSAWINPSDLSGTDYKGIVGKYGSTAPEANKRAYQLAVNNGTDKLRALVDSSCTGGVNKQLDGTTSLSAGTWYHAAFVFKAGSAITLYLNGAQDGTTSTGIPSNISDCNEALWIGITNSTTTTASSFPGKIDDVRIYNRALSAGEVANMYNTKSSANTISDLAAQYKIDRGVYRDISGSKLTIDDSSDNNGYGRLMNGSSDSPAADGVTNGPLWTSSSPVVDGRVLWVGTNGSGSDDGALTAISMDTDKQVTAYTSTSSGLPDLDVTSLSLNRGGLALVGTEVGAWNPGTAGYPVDDTATSSATAIAPVRSKGGTIRSKGGTVRVRGT